jgi:signal transduction histidine kinase
MIQTKPRLKLKGIHTLSPMPSDLQKFVELGRLSASLLHEISNPLAAALIHLEELDDKKSYSIRETKRSLKRIERYIKSARQQLRQESTVTSFSLNKQIKEVKQLVMPQAKSEKIALIIEKSPYCKLIGDHIRFQQIMANLIINAIEAYSSDQYPNLYKEVRVQLKFEHNNLCITVCDRGEGIAPSQIPKLFEPFYSTKRAGHGLGIGLLLVKQYVSEDFKGSINVISSARIGTKFIINLPAFSEKQ